MLERLEVEGLGIIEHVELELEDGFVALTGETGAGKSLLVESLKLLAGRRAQAELVRTGDARLRVEGWFSVGRSSSLGAILDELGVASGDELVIRREQTAAGRGRCWLNDVPVSAAALGRVAPELLAIHGQHEQHGLAEPAVQRQLVDEFGDHDALRGAVAEAYAGWSAAAEELARLQRAEAERRDRLDAIAFQLAEIDAVAPQPGEDESLAARRQVLRHAVRLMELQSTLLERLAHDEPAVLDHLARGERELSEMLECGLEVEATVGRLSEARVLVEEVVREVEERSGAVVEDPAELEQVESRLHRLEQLMLKYGSPLTKVLENRAALLAEQAELFGLEQRVEGAAAAAARALAGYDRAATALDEARRRASVALASEVEELLARLDMGGTTVELEWRPRPDPSSPLTRDGISVAFDADGVESCELLIAPNPGEALRPMARIASGGELSRIHLALRTVLRRRRGGAPLTLLFDEVDSGLGGGAAAALADLLGDVATTDQVLVVTHLPQVAAGGSTQFRVEKTTVDGRAVTRVARLDGEGRVRELARMLAGDEVTASALAHARELLGER